MDGQHDEPHEGIVSGAIKPEQQRHIGDGDAEHPDRNDSPDPNFDIGRCLAADDQQAERARRHHRARHAHDAAAQRIGMHDRDNHEPRRGVIAKMGSKEHRPHG